VCIMESYWVETRDKYKCTEDMQIYHLPGLPLLTKETLHKVMQRTVDDLKIGGGKCKFTSHSLRYGGATMLASAGFPHYIIAIYGGWSEDSKTLKQYTRPSGEMLALVSEHMAKMSLNRAANYFLIDQFIIEKAL
jgi:hypothetical protein